VTPLIVVILAVAWIVVLVPPLLRSRSDGRPSTSIGSFRQQLATLSRTGPDRRGVVRPLNRPMGVPRGPTRRPSGPGTPGRLAAVPHDEDPYDDGGAYAYGYDDRRAYGSHPARLGARPARTAPLGYSYSVRSGRADVRRRRLNVLVGLLAVAATTAVGGFGLGISALVAVNLLVDAVLVFYVYLLVQLRRAEEERALRGIWSQAA
jgi:hypothetical protein